MWEETASQARQIGMERTVASTTVRVGACRGSDRSKVEQAGNTMHKQRYR